MKQEKVDRVKLFRLGETDFAQQLPGWPLQGPDQFQFRQPGGVCAQFVFYGNQQVLDLVLKGCSQVGIPGQVWFCPCLRVMRIIHRSLSL